MESTLQKVSRIVISNIFAILVFVIVLEYGQKIHLASVEQWEIPLSMLIVYLIVLNYKILKGKV